MKQTYGGAPAILCGGSGTRLWPLSRSGFPKQFLCLTGAQSLFQLAAKRPSSLKSHDIAIKNPKIVTNEEYRFLVTGHFREIDIEPGTSLSPQKYYHRAEHWIVVRGTAEITCGNKTILLTKNQSTYIPLGEARCLHCPETIPLELIEVPSGSHLEEWRHC